MDTIDELSVQLSVPILSIRVYFKIPPLVPSRQMIEKSKEPHSSLAALAAAIHADSAARVRGPTMPSVLPV